MFDAISAGSIRDLLIEANSLGITKEQFVQILPDSEQYYLVFHAASSREKDHTNDDEGGV